jgi:hypothetical protein
MEVFVQSLISLYYLVRNYKPTDIREIAELVYVWESEYQLFREEIMDELFKDVLGRIKKGEPPHVYKSTVLQRGWTNRLIELFLSPLDKEVRNPHFGSVSPPAKLYLLSRME